MTNQVFYLTLAAFYGPVATYVLTSSYYRRTNNRELQRQWNEQVDAEHRRRHLDRVTFEQLQEQRERKLRAELTRREQPAPNQTERLDELERWQSTVESRLSSLLDRGETPDAGASEGAM